LFRNKIFEVAVRSLPHRNFIRTLYLAGRKTDEIQAMCVDLNFPQLSKARYELILLELQKNKDFDKMIKRNRKAQLEGRDLLLYDSVDANFKHLDVFHRIIKQQSPVARKASGTRALFQLLSKIQVRQYIECAVLSGMRLKKIIDGYNYLTDERLTAQLLSSYIYFFWNYNIASIEKNKITRLDIVKYLSIDKRSILYIPHKKLIHSTPLEIDYYFGIIGADTRVKLNKKILGLSAEHITRSLRTDTALNPLVVELYQKSENTIRDSEIAGKANETVMTEMNRIIDRISVVQTERKTIAELKREQKKGETFKDEPADI